LADQHTVAATSLQSFRQSNPPLPGMTESSAPVGLIGQHKLGPICHRPRPTIHPALLAEKAWRAHSIQPMSNAHFSNQQ